MRPVVTVVVLLGIALAGCSGDSARPDGAPALGDTQGAGTIANGTVPGSPGLAPTAGTVHLLDRPGVSFAPPTDGDGHRVRVWSLTDHYEATIVGVPQPPSDWTFAWPGQSEGVVGNATLWVDVQGPVLADPRGNCFWTARIGFADGDEVIGESDICAGNEPVQVPSGPRPLSFDFRFPDTFPAGTQVRVQVFGGIGPNPPGSEVVLLAGSAQYDGTLTFQGETFEAPASP